MKKQLQTFFCDKLFTALFIVTVLLVVATLVLIALPKSSVFYKAVNSVDTMPAGELFDGEELMLSFVSPKDNLKGISFKVSTYGREISAGKIVIKMFTEDGAELVSKDVAAESVKDQGQVDIAFPMIAGAKGKTFIVRFHTEGMDQSNAVSFMANDKMIDGVSTTRNDTTCANLVFTVQYDLANPNYGLRYAFDLALMSAVFFVLTVAAFGRNRPRKDPVSR